jgi:outer membrane protein TolC
MAVLALVAGLTERGRGQEVLQLHEAWELLLQQNRTLQQQQALVKKAEKEVVYLSREILPKVRIGAAYRYTSEIAEMDLPRLFPSQPALSIRAGVHDVYDMNVEVQQLLFTGGRLKNQKKVAAALRGSAVWQYRALQQKLLLQTGKLYHGIQLLSLQRDVLERAIQRAEIHLQKARSLLAARQIMAFDTLRVANQKLQLQKQLQVLDGLIRIQKERFARLLGMDRAPEIAPYAQKGAFPQLAEIASYQKEALKNRPDLYAVEHRVRAGLAKTRVARSAYFPQVAGVFAYHYARPGVNFFVDEWMTYYTVGISLRWELWNWQQTRTRVQQTKLETRAAEIAHEDLRRQILAEVREAYIQVQNRQAELEYQQRIVAQEKERYRITRTQFEQGMATSLDLSLAEQDVASAELQLQRLRIELENAWLQLKYATGTIGKKEE